MPLIWALRPNFTQLSAVALAILYGYPEVPELDQKEALTNFQHCQHILISDFGSGSVSVSVLQRSCCCRVQTRTISDNVFRLRFRERGPRISAAHLDILQMRTLESCHRINVAYSQNQYFYRMPPKMFILGHVLEVQPVVAHCESRTSSHSLWGSKLRSTGSHCFLR